MSSPIKPGGFLSLPPELRVKVYQFVAYDCWTKSSSVAGLILSNHQVKAEYEHERTKIVSEVMPVIRQKVEKWAQRATTSAWEIRWPSGRNLQDFHIGIPMLEGLFGNGALRHFYNHMLTSHWEQLKLLIHLMIQHLPSFGVYFYVSEDLTPMDCVKNFGLSRCGGMLLGVIGSHPLVRGHRKWHQAVNQKTDILEYTQPKPWFRDNSDPCRVCEEVDKVCA